MKNLAAHPGESQDTTFTLPQHLDQNLSAKQSAEIIAAHFANISQRFPPLSFKLLPERVQTVISKPVNPIEVPRVTEHDVFCKIASAKKSKLVLPGDLPKQLPAQLAKPATAIFNNIINSGDWASQWKVEYVTPVAKVKTPETEDDLRNISLTNFRSNVFEKFVLEWLLVFIGDQIDPGQYGGAKGNSISLYLIDLINFVHYNQDLDPSHAVLATMIDYSKAFNNQNHNILITILSDMGVPTWLLKIVMGFLKNRSIILRYRGECSSPKDLPGGGPQGTVLGMFLFLILINLAGFPHDDMEKELGSKITKPNQKRKVLKKTQEKYVDDHTFAEAINLKQNLQPCPPEEICRPLNFHNRTGNFLPDGVSIMNQELDKLTRYTEELQMEINIRKSKVMPFNPHRKYDFMPEVKINSIVLEVVEKTKLLGITLTSNLKWTENTKNLTARAYSRLWPLRRLKSLGTPLEELLDTYYKQVRSVLELAVPVWHPGLTVQDSKSIECVQKAALAIILGDSYHSYQKTRNLLDVKPLDQRREDLCLTFALKTSQKQKFKHWFVPTPRAHTTKYRPVWTRTDRYKRTPLPYLTNLLNNHFRHK